MPSCWKGPAVTGPDAGGHDRAAQGSPHGIAAALVVGRSQEARRGRRAGERDRVEPGGTDRLDQPVQRLGVFRRHPAVDRHLDHFGAGQAQCLDDIGQRLAVQLHRDPLAVQVEGGDQVLKDLTRRLRLRRPGFAQAGGADRTACLGPAGQHRGLVDGRGQLLRQAPGVGGLHPAAEPDAGGGDDDVERPSQAALRGGQQFAVVGQRHDPDRGPGDHLGAPALQRGAELLPAAGGGDAHRVPGQRPDLSLTGSAPGFAAHPAATSTMPSRTRTPIHAHGRRLVVQADPAAQIEDLLVQRGRDGGDARRGCRRCRGTARTPR